jgi:hypothetical protein
MPHTPTSKSCAAALSALGSVRNGTGLPASTTFRKRRFSSGPFGENIGEPSPRQIIMPQSSSQSQAPRASDVNSSGTQRSAISCHPEDSRPDLHRYTTEPVCRGRAGGCLPGSQSPFTRTGDMSRLSKRSTSTRIASDSDRSPNNTDVNTRGGGSLRLEQRLPSAVENSMQGPHLPPSNASPSLDDHERTLTPAQCKKWTDWSLAQDRIATRSDGGITLRKS